MPIVSQSEMEAHAGSAGITLTTVFKTAMEIVRAEVESQICKIIGYNPALMTYTEFYPRQRWNEPSDGDALNTGAIGFQRYSGGLERGQVAKGNLAVLSLPLRTVVSVNENPSAWDAGTVDGDWPTATQLAAGDYRILNDRPGYSSRGVIVRTRGIWSNLPASIKVVYTAGLSDAELLAQKPEIRRAVKISVMYNVLGDLVKSKAVLNGGLIEQSFSVTDFSTSYADLKTTGVGGFNAHGSIIPEEAMSLLTRNINLEGYF